MPSPARTNQENSPYHPASRPAPAHVNVQTGPGREALCSHARAPQHEHGCGLFAACLKGCHRLIGDYGREEIEVSGDRVEQSATTFEPTAGTGVTNRGSLPCTRLRLVGPTPPATGAALVQIGNTASARVAGKTGLKRIGRAQQEGRTCLRYEINRRLRRCVAGSGGTRRQSVSA